MAKKKLECIYALSDFQQARSVLVIGCGGTGGHLIPHLARYIKVNNERFPEIKLFLADGDFVEEKNLKRQHFIESDVSKNKAVVMAERYSSAFGLEIVAIPNDLESVKQIEDIFNFHMIPYDFSELLISCVDNNASRKIAYDWFIKDIKGAKFWIDSGNEERAGQVVCGHTPYGYRNSVKAGPYIGIRQGVFSMPCVMDCYPDLIKDDGGFNSQLSCADRSISTPQNMQANVSAATIIMNYARKIIDKEIIRSHGVEFSIDNVYNTKTNTEENLNKVPHERKRFWEKKR